MSKKILVVGGGGREHAIIKALKKSPDCGEIWCAPGNGGIRYDAKCKNIKATDVETMVGFAVEEKFDYVVVAQDDPLALGMVDELAKAGIPAFGPDKAAARHGGAADPIEAWASRGFGPDEEGLQGVLQGPDEEIRHPHREV